MKQECYICKEKKSINDFYKNQRKCKVCDGKVRREYYLKNRNKQRTYYIKRNKQLNNNKVVYMVTLDNKILYIGEGNFQRRKSDHLREVGKFGGNPFYNTSMVSKYIKENNIPKSQLQFSILSEENNIMKRKDLEREYRITLKPLLNSLI